VRPANPLCSRAGGQEGTGASLEPTASTEELPSAGLVEVTDMADIPPTSSTPASDVPLDLVAVRSTRLYTMLLDSIPSSVLLLDAHLRIVSANRNFLQKARLSVAEVIGQHLEKVFPPAIYQHMNFRLRVAEVFRTGEALKGERLVYRAPGLPARTYYYSLIPFRWEGKIEDVMLLMEDVTDMIRLGEEAHRAERHLASVVESASDLVLSMDLRGRILTWNTAAVRITGFEEGEVRHRDLADLCPADQRAALGRTLQAVPDKGRTGPLQVELVSREAAAIPISWVFSAMRDADRRVVGLVAVGRDLTERRKFEAQLLQSEKLAALGVMAGGIAHEIRNPLAVVSSAAQLLLQKPLARNVQLECAERIYRSVQRMAAIVEGLLRFARPSDKGAMKLLNLVAVVQEAMTLLANQVKLAKIELRTCYSGPVIPVRGSAGLLQQLVANLLLNAVNAMAERGGELRLTVERSGNQAILRVADSGRGISCAHLPKVFDPFFTTMPVGKGTGLGLSISYAIVQQHDGQIDISSQEGVGTTVTVSLPLATGGVPS